MTDDLFADSDPSSQVALTFGSPLRQNRATVFFRIILAIPQIVVLYFLALAAFVVLVIGWFAALITGSLPRGIAKFLSGYLRWSTRVSAYQYLLTDKYPPFSLQPSAAFPVDLEVHTGRLNRWAVLFRYFLAIPGAIAACFLIIGMQVFSIVNWIVTLIKGEQPPMFFEAHAAGLRYYTRYSAYFFMLTSYYPSGLMGDVEPSTGPDESPANAQEPAALIETASEHDIADQADPSSGSSLDFSTSTEEDAEDPELANSLLSVPESSSALAFPGFGTVQSGSADRDDVTERKWSLFVSAGAKNLVVVFIILGIVAVIAEIVLIGAAFNNTASRDQAITAQNQAVSAYNAVARAAGTYSLSSTACKQSATSDNGEVACLEANDAKFAGAFDAFDSSLSAINFPITVNAEVSATQSAASQAGVLLRRLAGAGSDAQSYQSAATSSNLQTVFSEFDTNFSRLNSTLLRQ